MGARPQERLDLHSLSAWATSSSRTAEGMLPAPVRPFGFALLVISLRRLRALAGEICPAEIALSAPLLSWLGHGTAPHGGWSPAHAGHVVA